MPQDNDDREVFRLTLPWRLMDPLEEAARKEGWSVVDEIIRRLEQSFRGDTK